MSKDRPNSLWPMGSRFDLLDADRRNPIEVRRVAVDTNDLHVVGEDANGIRHYAHTDRIVSEARFEKKAVESFDDLLGTDADEFEDLL